MQLPTFQVPSFNLNYFRSLQEKWRRWPNWKWYICGIIVLVILGYLVWLIPPVRVKFWDLGQAVGRIWSGQSVERVVTSSPRSIPTGQLEQRVAVLEEEYANLQDELQNLQKSTTQLNQSYTAGQADLKSAVTEVSKMNDLINSQQAGWLSALKKVGISVKADGSVDQASLPTQSLGSASQNVSTDPSPIPKKVNINTAQLAELDSLPGIGPTYAQRIITYREEKGPFKSPEDIQNVTGIGPATFAKLKDYIET